MNKIALSFLITCIAGFSTLLGMIPCYFNEKNKNMIIATSLAFSSGIMLSISLVSLIPESLNLLSGNYKLFPAILLIMIFIVAGILTSSSIDEEIEKNLQKSKLYKLGIISIIALILHNIPEGITTFISTNTNTRLGLTISLAIALHNIPEGIAIAIPICYSTGNKKKAFLYTFISGFSELFGAILAYLFIAKYINSLILSAILGATAGIMIHISIYELLPNSFDYKNKRATIVAFVIGFITMLLCDMIF